MTSRRALWAAIAAGLSAAAPAGAQATNVDGAPWCDNLEPGTAGGMDCVLDSPGNMLVFEFDLVEGVGRLILTQATPEGGERVVSDPIEIDGVAANAPGLRDINLDGVDDLFIPVSESMVNNAWFVWQMNGEGVYEPSGFIDGGTIGGFENRGELIIAVERLNAATYIESARLLDADGFIHVYDMRVDYAAQDCSIVDPNGVMAAGLNADALVAECLARGWE